jgi:hypothetical protein
MLLLHEVSYCMLYTSSDETCPLHCLQYISTVVAQTAWMFPAFDMCLERSGVRPGS